MNLADPNVIQRALRQRSVAVVGMSANELRASHFVGYYLQRHGYQVTPVNPGQDSILGLTCYPSLQEVPHPIDVVDVFRDPSAVPEIAQQAIDIGAKFLWLQFGVISQPGVELASGAGVECIVDRCMKIEHARYMGRMHWLGFNTGQLNARRQPMP